MKGIGIVHIHGIFEVWVLETPYHQQAGDFVEKIFGPLPTQAWAEALAVRYSGDNDILLLSPN